MSKYETTIPAPAESNELEIEVEVDFDFQPAEKMTHDYPGCDASVEINYVEVAGGRTIELSKEDEELLAEEILDWAVNYDDERWDY